MKKQYINPTMSIFNVEMQNQLLAGSGVNKSGDTVQSVGISGSDFDSGSMVVKGRSGSVWGYDEEEF